MLLLFSIINLLFNRIIDAEIKVQLCDTVDHCHFSPIGILYLAHTSF